MLMFFVIAVDEARIHRAVFNDPDHRLCLQEAETYAETNERAGRFEQLYVMPRESPIAQKALTHDIQ